MPTVGRPLFAVRMDPEEIEHLHDAARVYGSLNASEFVREMFAAMLSPDAEVRLSYCHKLAVKMGEQLTLDLAAPVRESRKSRNPRNVVTMRKKRRARNARTSRP